MISEHARQIVLVVIDNDYFKDVEIKANDIFSLLTERLRWYCKNIIPEEMAQCPQYMRGVLKEVVTYLKSKL